MLLITSVMSLGSLAFAGDAVRWAASPRQATEAAERTGRMILVTVGADWCHYCRKMEQDVWKRGQIEKVISESYVPLRLDSDHHQDLIGRLQVQAFPTTLVFSPDRKLIARMEGYVDAERMHTALDRLRTTRQTAVSSYQPQR